MTSLLADVSRWLEAEQHWAEIEAAYERLRRDHPQSWTEHLGELAEWDTVGTDPGQRDRRVARVPPVTVQRGRIRSVALVPWWPTSRKVSGGSVG